MSRSNIFRGAVWLVLAFQVTGCDREGDAQIYECTPEGACSCEPGVERTTRCTCVGGSDCVVEGDSIEFLCEGNAACGLTCGTTCLITCPGTTSCSVLAGDDAVVVCPGTATCDITCLGDCSVSMDGASRAVVHCAGDGAACEFSGCSPTDCGDGVHACRTACPE